MRKRSASHDLGTFPSPGAPQYRGSSIGCQKGWASERLPPPPTTVSGGRQIGSAAVMTFNSGRTLPSKWEDAERWIFSPLSSTSGKSLNSQPQKRPKSKSGPIVQTASGTNSSTAYYSSYHSPFSTGVLAAEHLYGGGGGGVPLSRLASSVPGWSELRESNGCPSPKVRSPGAEKNDQETLVSRAISQRDMATQMSPKDCRCSVSSTVGRSLFASSPPALLSIMEQQSDQQSDHSAKLEVRDVEVDKGATVIRWSKKCGVRLSKKGQPDDSNDSGETAMGVSTSSFDVSDAAMDNSKWQREEAKITAWENLQKAKAEAAIRKLEMKLEKKRSATMDKIIDKLQMAQSKAHKMRSKWSSDNHDSHAHQHQEVRRAPQKLFSFQKHIRVRALSRFFICRAF